MGMGLAICRNIIIKSGGSISVFSEGQNKGSTFVFSMEMKLVDPDLFEQSVLHIDHLARNRL
jgi:signal transduction histidine kinase